MSYLTAAQLKARVGGEDQYVQLTDDDGDGATDANVQLYVLEQVDDIVDGFARRGGYTTPLALSDVAEIEPFLLDIANYRAKTRNNREATEDDRKLYDDAMKVLYAIADGTFKLPSFTSTPSVGLVGMDSYAQLFNRDTLKDF